MIHSPNATPLHVIACHRMSLQCTIIGTCCLCLNLIDSLLLYHAKGIPCEVAIWGPQILDFAGYLSARPWETESSIQSSLGARILDTFVSVGQNPRYHRPCRRHRHPPSPPREPTTNRASHNKYCCGARAHNKTRLTQQIPLRSTSAQQNTCKGQGSADNR